MSILGWFAIYATVFVGVGFAISAGRELRYIFRA